MKVFKNKVFYDAPEIDTFGVSWDNGESQDDFLKKANFNTSCDRYCGVLRIFTPTPERYLTHPEKDFYVEIDSDSLFCDFYIPSIIDLIDFCHYIGLNFSEIIKEQQICRRVIHQNDIEEDGSFLSVVPLDEGMVFVTSFDLITTEEERMEYRASRRKAREKERAKKEAEKQMITNVSI